MEKPYYRSLVDALKSVDRPGSYAGGGKISMPLPGISLTSQLDCVLGLPLCDCHVKKLIEVASRAPFGRGTDTIVDTTVRCTWQLSPAQFRINNPDWEESMQMVLTNVKKELGCSARVKVTCELYKLLLYEPGGFFKVSVINIHTHTKIAVLCGFHKNLYSMLPVEVYRYGFLTCTDI